MFVCLFVLCCCYQFYLFSSVFMGRNRLKTVKLVIVKGLISSIWSSGLLIFISIFHLNTKFENVL